MNEISIEQVFESLEIFIKLKQQNLLIFAWMEMKKIFRKGGQNSHKSRSRSVRSHSIFNYEKEREFRIEDGRSDHSRKSLNKVQQYTLQHANPNRTPNNYQQQARVKREEDMYNTFGKMPSSIKSSKNINQQTPKHDPRPAQARHAYTQGIEDESISDQEQFEDIILDRLTKLEENVNRIMRQKRQKQMERGYVGAPITPQLYSGKSKNSAMMNGSQINAYLAEAAQQNIRNMHQQLRSSKQDLLHLYSKQQKGSKARLKQHFQEAHRDNSSHFGSESDMSRNRYDANDGERRQKIGKPEFGQEIKYIPMSKQPQANIEKIREIVQRASRKVKPKDQTQDQNINIQRLNFGQKQQKVQRKFDTSYRSEQNTSRNDKGGLDFVKQNRQRQILFKREPANESFNGKQKQDLNHKSSKNMIHFIPSHVQMRSAIEGMKNKKYFRNANNVLNRTSELKRNNESFEFPNPKSKVSGSDQSRVSYQTSKLNNLSSYY